jgi:putative transposase
MTRVARVVYPGVPYHIAQRGNNRREVFFVDDDREAYLRLVGRQAARYGLEILGCCLMTNRVHLVAVPREGASLAKASPNPRYRAKNQGVPGFPWVGDSCARTAEPYHRLGLELRLGFPRYTLMFSRHVDIFGKSGPKSIKKGSSFGKKT